MTDIRISLTENNFSIILSGHAFFAPKGKDIVCAGLSALCMAFDAVIKSEDTKDLCDDFSRVVDDGFYSVTVKGIKSEEKYREFMSYAKLLMKGFSELEEKYPENLRCKFYIESPVDLDIDTSEQTMKTKERKEEKGNGY